MAARAVLSLFLLSLIVFVNTAPFTGYCLLLRGLQQPGCHTAVYPLASRPTPSVREAPDRYLGVALSLTRYWPRLIGLWAGLESPLW